MSRADGREPSNPKPQHKNAVLVLGVSELLCFLLRMRLWCIRVSYRILFAGMFSTARTQTDKANTFYSVQYVHFPADSLRFVRGQHLRCSTSYHEQPRLISPHWCRDMLSR